MQLVKKKIRTLFVLGVFAASYSMSAQSSTAGFVSPPSILDDPEWQKRFLGSYGFMPELEPKVNQEELIVLRDLIDLMKTDVAAASQQLSLSINENSSAAMVFILANLYFQQGELEQAEKYYTKAVAKHPSFLRAHKNLGLLYTQNQDFKKALQHLSRAVELGEHDGRNHGLMGYSYLATGDYLAAEESYRDAIQQEPNVVDWKMGLARALLETERYNEAVAIMDALIATNPDDAKYWLLQSNAYLGMGRPEDAAVDLEMVRALGAAKPESLLLLGNIYLNMQMPDAALEVYLEAIEGDERKSGYTAAYHAANLLLQTRSYEESQAIIAKIKSTYSEQLTNDQQLEVLTLEAKIARGQQDNERAVTILESIVQRDGTRGDALIELSDYYAAIGERERAMLLIERAENLEAFEYDALVKHAQLLTKEREYTKAAALLKRALILKEDARVQRFLEQVERAAKS